ncbi:MAG: (2Fe-2S)-binding protein [Candidatus Thermoplasmatota archaeon]|jgi:carbon-monoxide dehydrogenase small subunit|nr:(2Fe-2S)-binding protein [Candidatus Thermoplasmatota archaeon]
MVKKEVTVTINGKEYSSKVEPRMLLVHFIRDVAGLTGTHVGCDTSNCGACTVVLDGKAVKSCTVLAVQCDNKRITTVEGLSKDGKLHPIQKSFVDKHGLQCGYCTSGMIMTSFWLLQRNRNPSEKQIREALSGNLCRCTGYENIVKAVKEAARNIMSEQNRDLVKEEAIEA